MYAKLDAIIVALNEQHEYFVSEMKECGILHGTNPSLASPGFEVSLNDDYEYYSLPLEPNFIAYMSLTGLEEVIDCPLISPPFVASSLSSTLRDTTEDVLRLLSSPIP